jgi:hypothetical protein
LSSATRLPFREDPGTRLAADVPAPDDHRDETWFTDPLHRHSWRAPVAHAVLYAGTARLPKRANPRPEQHAPRHI